MHLVTLPVVITLQPTEAVLSLQPEPVWAKLRFIGFVGISTQVPAHTGRLMSLKVLLTIIFVVFVPLKAPNLTTRNEHVAGKEVQRMYRLMS